MENSTSNVQQAAPGRLPDLVHERGINRGRHLAAVALALLPTYGFAVLLHLSRTSAYTIGEMLAYPLVVGGMGVLWIAFLNRSLCNESLGDLNLRGGTWQRDLLAGAMLAAALLALFYVEQRTIYRWLPGRNQDVSNLIRALARDPFLLALWLGPVVWIGVAGFEEISRVFLLKRLWSVGRSRAFQWLAILISAGLFGVAHVYQGAAGVAGAGIRGLLLGWIYMKFGRIRPLIIAHALYDSAQIIHVLSLIWRGSL